MTEWDQVLLRPAVAAALRRAKLRSARDVLSVSAPELRCLTGLSRVDVGQLLSAASKACRGNPPTPAIDLQRGTHHGFKSSHRLSLACPVLDGLLRGGLPLGGIAELSGESGAGKTQLALQLSLSVQYPPEHGGLNAGAVYICTEDTFPSKRLQQLIGEQAKLRADVPAAVISAMSFSDRIYVEHTADLASLQACLARRVPLLLARGEVRLLVVDSVAALFRAEFQAGDWQEKTRQLLSFAAVLHRLSQEHGAPVLCINQVTDVIDGSECVHDRMGIHDSKVSPALGLAWANQVMVRLMMHRTQGTVCRGQQSSARRRLEVVFAPHLPRDSQDFAVWREGVRGVPHT